MQEINLNEFPTTRYQGSKRKIVPWIYSVVKDLKFETALDAFGGSSSVSFLFKKMNKRVTYNDILNFNFIIGKAIIENGSTFLTNEDISNLLIENEGILYNDFIQSTFNDFYYLPEENNWLDKVTSNIVNMNHYQPPVLEYKRCLAYYALFQACLIKRPFNLFHRKNLYIRTSDVDRNFGNKTTWDKSFNEYLVKFANEVNTLVFDSGKECNSTNQSAFVIDPLGFDLVYLDPPYMRKDCTNESSNYSKCYHFLEGLSRYNDWQTLIDFQTKNLRTKNAGISSEFGLKGIQETYEKLINHYKNNIILLSYKKGGVPSIEFLEDLIKKVKGNVYTVSMHYKYALNHQNGDSVNNREVLIIGI